MDLDRAQATLKELFLGGAFNFDDNLDIISELEYVDIINNIEPTNYEVAYEAFEGHPHEMNVLEKCHVDTVDDRTTMIRRERTYSHDNYRVFQLDIQEIPPLVISENGEQTLPKRLLTTWWLNGQGHTIHYRQTYNGAVLEEVGILK